MGFYLVFLFVHRLQFVRDAQGTLQKKPGSDYRGWAWAIAAALNASVIVLFVYALVEDSAVAATMVRQAYHYNDRPVGSIGHIKYANGSCYSQMCYNASTEVGYVCPNLADRPCFRWADDDGSLCKAGDWIESEVDGEEGDPVWEAYRATTRDTIESCDRARRGREDCLHASAPAWEASDPTTWSKLRCVSSVAVRCGAASTAIDREVHRSRYYAVAYAAADATCGQTCMPPGMDGHPGVVCAAACSDDGSDMGETCEECMYVPDTAEGCEFAQEHPYLVLLKFAVMTVYVLVPLAFALLDSPFSRSLKSPALLLRSAPWYIPLLTVPTPRNC